MSGNVLDGCGRYSDDLNEIAGMIIQNKLHNGEEVSTSERREVEDRIFLAYQNILSNMKDYPNGISTAIKTMKNCMEKTGDIAHLDASCQTAIEIAIEDEQYFAMENEMGKEGLVAAAETIILTENILDQENVNKVDQMFNNEEFKEAVDENLLLAREGNLDSAKKIDSLELATKFLYKNGPKTVNGKEKMQALAIMMRMAATESKISKDMLREFAEKYGLENILIDDNGQKEVDLSKLEMSYQEELDRRGSKSKIRTIEDFKEVSQKLAKEHMEKGKYGSKKYDSAETVKDMSKHFAEHTKLRGLIKTAFENKDKETLDKLIEKNPELVSEILDQRKAAKSPEMQRQNRYLERKLNEFGQKTESTPKKEEDLGEIE